MFKETAKGNLSWDLTRQTNPMIKKTDIFIATTASCREIS